MKQPTPTPPIFPLPWKHETEAGCLGHITDATGNTVAQVQEPMPTLPGCQTSADRNKVRDDVAARIAKAVNDAERWAAVTVGIRPRQYLSHAIEELAKAIGCRSDEEPLRLLSHIGQAEKYLSEVRALFMPAPPWTEEQGNLSQQFHCFMRKCDDSAPSRLLYQFIDNDVGMVVWQLYIMSIHEDLPKIKNERHKKQVVQRASQRAKERALDSQDKREYFMALAIEVWTDNDEAVGPINALDFK